MLFYDGVSTCGVSFRRPSPEIGLLSPARRTRVPARPDKRIPTGLTARVRRVRTRPDGEFKRTGHRLNPEAPSSGAGLTGDARVTGDISIFSGVTPVSPGGWRGGHRGGDAGVTGEVGSMPTTGPSIGQPTSEEWPAGVGPAFARRGIVVTVGGAGPAALHMPDAGLSNISIPHA